MKLMEEKIRSKRDMSFIASTDKHGHEITNEPAKFKLKSTDGVSSSSCKQHTSSEFWFELLTQLDFYDAKILEHVYKLQDGATTLLQIIRHLRHVGIKREAIRQRVLTLASIGLLDIAERTKPLCIRGSIELEAKVVSLIQGVYQRLRVKKN